MNTPSRLPFALTLPLLAGCTLYDPPPEPRIAHLADGLLPSSASMLEIAFSEPVDPASLRLSVVPLTTDAEGALPDEDTDPLTVLTPYFTYGSGSLTTGGKAAFNGDNTLFYIAPYNAFPVGPKLAVLIEQGLSDAAGNQTGSRRRLPFAYEFVCQGTPPKNPLPSGAYFFLFDIDKPIGVQIQILADVRVDPQTGTLLAQFTNADRDPRKDRCPFPCADTEVCRLLPEPECVAPSDPAGSVDEYADYVPHPDPPTGYSFTVHGCAEDSPDGSTGVATLPTDLVVEKPPVQAIGLAITCSFTTAADGALRCTGSSGSEDVLIGDASAGPAEGSSAGRLIPPEDTPPDLPAPPEE